MTVRLLTVTVLLMGLSVPGVSSLDTTSPGQVPTPASPDQPAEPPVFRVGVDVIRVDAVVTGRDGRMVTDLTAADFEVRQDGKRQQIVAARYVSVEAPPAAPARRAARPSATRTFVPAPPVPSRPLASPSQVQRTIAIVVDDLGIAWENMEPTRRALRRFVEEHIHEGDLVALVRTGRSVSTLQQFTTDKRRLYAAVDQVRWNGFSRRAVSSFQPLNNFLPTGNFGFRGGDPNDLGQVDELREAISAAGTLGAVTLTMQGLRDLPGRKALVLISEGFVLTELGKEGPGDVPYQPHNIVHPRLERLIDYALRTGVVLYTMDPRGLQTAGPTAEDSGPAFDWGTRRRFLLDTQDTLAYMAEETGGLAMLNSNDLAHGLRRISDDQRGYYVVGYTPPEGTFAKPGKTARYRRISVRVKRPGVKVRTRKGFLGVSDEVMAPAPLTAKQQLFRTATSPFSATDIPMRLTVLPRYRPGEGTFVRALVHVEGRGLQFGRDDAGREVAAIDVLGLVFDESGAAVEGRNATFELERVERTDGQDRAGVVFSMTVPVKRAGGYQVRFAIRDEASGALGAAGQFVEVPDIADGDLAISGLLVGEESAGLQAVSMLAEDAGSAAAGPALRVFKAGARLVYACEIYNARERVETRISVWRNGKPFFTAEPTTLTPPPGKGRQALPAGGGIKLGEHMPPGGYVLQMVARMPAGGRGKVKTAVQWVDFTIDD